MIIFIILNYQSTSIFIFKVEDYYYIIHVIIILLLCIGFLIDSTIMVLKGSITNFDDKKIYKWKQDNSKLIEYILKKII